MDITREKFWLIVSWVGVIASLVLIGIIAATGGLNLG